MALKDDFADIVARAGDITEIEDKVSAVNEALTNAESINDLKAQLATAKKEAGEWKDKYSKKWDEAIRTNPVNVPKTEPEPEKEITFDNIDIMFDGRSES